MNLDHHLLETPDGLVTALLRHLVGEVVLGALLTFTDIVLRVVGDVLASLLLERRGPRLGSSDRIDTGAGALLLILSCRVGDVGGITRAAWVRCLASITYRIFEIAFATWALLAVCGLDLVLDVARRQVRDVMPCVIIRWFIDLGQLLIGWVDLVGGLLSGISSNVANQDRSIVYWGHVSLFHVFLDAVNLRSFRNWPLEMMSVPRVRRPSRASFPCCFAVSLSTGAPGTDALPPSMFCDCQTKS